MRLRISIRAQMVGILLIASACYWATVFGPEIRERWIHCREKADAYESDARIIPVVPTSVKCKYLMRKEKEAYESDLLRKAEGVRLAPIYRGALWKPWQFYELGN